MWQEMLQIYWRVAGLLIYCLGVYLFLVFDAITTRHLILCLLLLDCADHTGRSVAEFASSNPAGGMGFSLSVVSVVCFHVVVSAPA